MSRLRMAFVVVVAGVLSAAIMWASRQHSAPEITLTTLAGKPIALRDLRGKVVLVNFWATTCAVCARELPDIVATYRTYSPRGLEVIAVAMPYDRPDWVVDYVRGRQLPFTVALDYDGTVSRAFGGIDGTPTAFLIDKRGTIVLRSIGEPDFAQLRASIRRELDRPVKG